MRSNGYSQKIFKNILFYVLHNSKIVTTFALETYRMGSNPEHQPRQLQGFELGELGQFFDILRERTKGQLKARNDS